MMQKLIKFVVPLLLLSQSVAAAVSGEYLAAWREEVQSGLKAAEEAQQELLRQQHVLLEDIRERMKNAERARSAVTIRTLSTEERAALGRIEVIEGKISRIDKTLALVDRMVAEALHRHNIRVVRFEGTVLYGDDEITVPLVESIKSGDSVTLETGDDGFVELISTDGSNFQIGPGSRLQVDASSEARTRYRVDHGQLHGRFTCVEMPGADCREFLIEAGEYSASTHSGEISYQLISSGERRFFVLEGEANLALGELEMPGVPMNSMISITAERQVHGPMRLNFSWMPLWWRAYE